MHPNSTKENEKSMGKEFHREESESLMASEPTTVYGSAMRMTMPAGYSSCLRVASDEEIEQCITLEQLHEELTEMIHEHYHAES